MKDLGTSYTKELILELKKFGETRSWHLKYAKFNRFVHQSLLSHSVNVASLSHSILKYLDELGYVKATERLELQCMLTGFLHDAGKENDRFQGAVLDFLSGKGPEPLDFGHQQERDVAPVLNDVKKELTGRFETLAGLPTIWDEVLWSVTQLGRRENAASVSHSFKIAPSKESVLCTEIVHLADLMMSMRSIEQAASIKPEGQVVSKLQVVYSKVSAVRGVLTHFLHMALEQVFMKYGFRPVQWYPDGTLFLGSLDLKMPVLDQSTLIDSIVEQMHQSLYRNQSSRLAKAAFGDLNARVIAAPEFLFVSDEVIHEFWLYVSRRRFAKPAMKKIDGLSDTERRIYKLFEQELNGGEEDILNYIARFSADFNLLIILYAVKKQLIDHLQDSRSERKNREQEINRILTDKMSSLLDMPSEAISEWPEIALQTKAESRLPVARTLWKSPYYSNFHLWQEKFVDTLITTTLELAKLWRQYVPDKHRRIAQLLVEDISSPISIGLLNEVNNLNKAIEQGKLGRGTQICEECGGVASIEAQAGLFGKSEIYHDHLVAGRRVGGGNKIRVCELCEFEKNLRMLFVENGRAVLILPQLTLSRGQMIDWQEWTNRIKFGDEEMPSIMKLERWAELLLDENIGSVFFFSERELTHAVQRVIEEEAIDLSMVLEPSVDVASIKEAVKLIREGKCRLKQHYNDLVNSILNRVEPIYISPNYILLLINGSIGRKGEPESSEAIRWTLFRCILARLFHATVLDADSPFIEEGTKLGYTTVPPAASLKSLVRKLNVDRGWITIPQLKAASQKLAALILLSRELYSVDADYGHSTLLRLIDEPPGRVLVRISLSGNRVPVKVINYMDIWSEGEKRELVTAVGGNKEYA